MSKLDPSIFRDTDIDTPDIFSDVRSGIDNMASTLDEQQKEWERYCQHVEDVVDTLKDTCHELDDEIDRLEFRIEELEEENDELKERLKQYEQNQND